MNFTREDVDTVSRVRYLAAEDFPKWKIHRPGSYAEGFEWMADEVWDIHAVTLTFHKVLGHWVLNLVELRLSMVAEDRSTRFNHVQLNEHSGGDLPWWLVKLAASAAQEA